MLNHFSCSIGEVLMLMLYTGCGDIGDQNNTIVLNTLIVVCIVIQFLKNRSCDIINDAVIFTLV